MSLGRSFDSGKGQPEGLRAPVGLADSSVPESIGAQKKLLGMGKRVTVDSTGSVSASEDEDELATSE